MVAQTEVEDEAQSENENVNVQKDVTIIAYADDSGVTGDREFANLFDPEGRDFNEREESERQNRYLRHYNSDEGQYEEEYLSEDAYNVLMNTSAFDPDNNDRVTLRREVTCDVNHKHRTQQAVVSVMQDAFDELWDAEKPALEDYRLKAYGPQIQDGDTWEDLVTFNPGRISSQTVLVHQAERTDENRFEGDQRRKGFSLTINMDASEEEVDTFSNVVIPHFMSYISQLNGVGKVRVSDCKKRVEKEGDCFDAL